MQIRQGVSRRDLLKAGFVLAGTTLLAACSGGTSAPPAAAPTTAPPAAAKPTNAPAAAANPTSAPAAAAAPAAAPAAGATTAPAAASGANAQAGGLAEIQAAAQKEGGQVLWYTAGNPLLGQKVSDAFKAAFPWTNLQAVPVVFTDMPNKIITEAVTGAPTADVIWCPPTLRQGFLEKDIFVKVNLINDSLMPPETLDPDGYAHPAWQLLTSIVFNTNMVQAEPKDPTELADPSYKGKICFDRVQNLGQSTTWLSVWRKQWGDDKWLKWLDGLKANDIFLTPNAGGAYEAVLRGERAIGISDSNSILKQAAGTPVKMDFSIRPTPFWNHAYLTKRAAHPASARFFMEWASSKDGQAAVAQSGLTPAMAIDVPTALSKFLPADAKPFTAAELADFSNNTSDYVKLLGDRWPA